MPHQVQKLGAIGGGIMHFYKPTSNKENLYDKRPFLGLPAWYKEFKLLK
jgi:hypothetical protein